MDDQTLYRAAGISAAIALVTLMVAGIALALFFGGRGAFFGPINDVFLSATTIALILPIIAVDRMTGEPILWLRIVTIAAVAGAVLIAVGQILLVLGVIRLEDSYITGGLGFLPILAWMIALVILSLGMGVVPVAVGWTAAATLSLIVLEAVVGSLSTGLAMWVATIALVIALLAWLGSLSASLLTRATS
jgi:hypothetical protein